MNVKSKNAVTLVGSVAPICGLVLAAVLVTGPGVGQWIVSGLMVGAWGSGLWTMALLAGAAAARRSAAPSDPSEMPTIDGMHFTNGSAKVIGHECGWVTQVDDDEAMKAAVWYHMTMECPLREDATT